MRHNDYLPTMRRLIALFPQREIGAETIAAYYDLLSDLDGDVFRLAVRQCAETCDWFPTVKQLREAAIDAACRAQGIKAPDEAWAATLAVARGWGEGMSVRARFDDATWTAVQSIGGIRVVALAEDGAGIARVEKSFRTAYEAVYRREAQTAVTLPLPEPIAMLPNGAAR